ncbi:MAG TPA: hypothetical protein VNL34_04175 [Candidatus Nitrosotenuis sp.]|nr:hypothetical protein [Candidatus Nitrosotenuis sp.]
MLVIGTLQTASAHKSEVIGDYKIEVGWEKEPPLVGVDNKIVVIITYAFQHEKTDSAPDPKLAGKYGKGISGLETKLDVAVTLNKEKIPLTMTETDTGGLYAANFAPKYDGYPIVHVFAMVNETPIEVDFHPERVEDGTIIQTMTSDGSLNAQILATTPQRDRRMLIMLEFTDKEGKLAEHVNYDILATQNEIEILSKTKLHSEDGLAKHTTMMLNSSEPVQVQLKILGVGLPGDELNWIGPANEVITIQVVPEFGPFWVLILASIMGTAIIITKNVKRSV